MEYLNYAVTFFFLIGFVMFGFGVYEARTSKHESASEKLQRIREQRGSLAHVGMDADLEAQREFERKFAREQEEAHTRPRGQVLRSVDEITTSFTILTRLDEQLKQINSFWRASEMLIATLVLALVVLLVTTYIGLGWWGLIPAFACLPLPWIYVRVLRARYYRRFDDQLADTLMLMSNSLRAGFSFLQALEMVAREAPFPIGNEFRLVSQEIAVGVPITGALENLARRINSSDLDLVVTAVVIQRETGGALAEILDIIAAVIHERMRIRGEIRTLTAQGRLTGAVLSFLPISLGLILHFVSRMAAPNDPSFVEPLLYEQLGRLMLMTAVAMEIVGFLWIWKIVSIRV
jgi:tight adherence protein B